MKWQNEKKAILHNTLKFVYLYIFISISVDIFIYIDHMDHILSIRINIGDNTFLTQLFRILQIFNVPNMK